MACDHDHLGQPALPALIEPLLRDLRAVVERDAPSLLELLDVFAQEARFAREWLTSSLQRLRPDETILEVGAGLMLVSCQLVREGYRVTALEPVGDGFSAFVELQRIVLGYAMQHAIAPEILAVPVELLERRDAFGFAFSVNVMEHVDSVPSALDNIGRSLKPGGSYRFTCPNYLFPYEPHFDIPTLFSKTLTRRVFGQRIMNSRQVSDQAGLWRSLNWISVPMIRRACRAMPQTALTFDRSMLSRTFARLVDDPVFASRRSRWVRRLAAWMVGMGLHKGFAYFPAVMQPVIDCTLTRVPPRHPVAESGVR